MSAARTGVIGIEACAAWPVGRWPLAPGCSLVAVAALTRAWCADMFPVPFDPIGLVERGSAIVDGDVTVEVIDGHAFQALYLETVRASFPGVRWRVELPPLGQAEAIHAAYGCLDGRVVAVVVEILHVDPGDLS